MTVEEGVSAVMPLTSRLFEDTVTKSCPIGRPNGEDGDLSRGKERPKGTLSLGPDHPNGTLSSGKNCTLVCVFPNDSL
jgi:hypothetical protein